MDGTRATVVPSDRQTCVMDRDCVVAEWSEWSGTANAQYCDTETQGETRSRHIVSFSVGHGRPCPHLSETRPRDHTVECKYR